MSLLLLKSYMDIGYRLITGLYFWYRSIPGLSHKYRPVVGLIIQIQTLEKSYFPFTSLEFKYWLCMQIYELEGIYEFLITDSDKIFNPILILSLMRLIFWSDMILITIIYMNFSISNVISKNPKSCISIFCNRVHHFPIKCLGGFCEMV